MRVLICGEGPHDIGRIERWSIRDGRTVTQDGWLQPLLRSILEGNLDFTVVPRSRLVSFPGAEIRPRPPGHGLKAAIAKSRALSEGCDLVVFMVDADSTTERDWREKIDEILVGFNSQPGDVDCIACVPMGTSEAWLLSDDQAWNQFGDVTPSLPTKPEELWGRPTDPNGNHPKLVFERTCASISLDDCVETRSAIMEASRPDVIVEKCPVSFRHFLDCLRSKQAA